MLRVIIVTLLCITAMQVMADDKLIGTVPPDLEASIWINSDPIKLENLHGKVVLIRWWTAPDCPFCKASSVALNEWHEKYSSHGLQVLGMYHHKTTSPLTPDLVKSYAEKFAFTFPIGIDKNWDTLRKWWMYEKRDWTSVSFLLDKNGVIQFIHPGGDYVKGDRDYQILEERITTLLKQ